MTGSFQEKILAAPQSGGLRIKDYWVWCGSVIKGEDGRYHMFASRWPQNLPFFTGYLKASEVVRAVADTPVGPYKFEEVVLPARGEQFWDGLITHNPTIHKSGDTYLLFYIGATAPAGTGNFRIGLATSKSVKGPWERKDEPVLGPRPGKWDGRLVTNPAPCVLPDGRIMLVYRSNTPNGLRLGAAMADNYNSEFVRISDTPVIEFEQGHHVEDPYIWFNNDHFEMLAKDWTGINGEKGAGIHAQSTDGINWELFPQSKAYSRKVLWDDGSVTEQGHLERPQLLIEGGKPTHLFLATGDGPSGWEAMATTRMNSTWNMVIPLK